MARQFSKRTVSLMVAEGCNLKCRYCFEHFKRPVRMDFETAKEAVDRYLTVDDGVTEEVVIDFMGGEPMIAFPLIKQVVDYVQSRDWPVQYHFSMSTNGTLFNEENKRWFVEHREVFTPMLSLDGTKAAHDFNRSDSYDRIMPHVPFLSENWPFQSFRMTINNDSLPYMADGAFSILSMGVPVEMMLVFEDVWGAGEEKARNLEIMEYELARMVDFYSEYPELDPPMFLDLPIHNCLGQDTDEDWRWCGAGEAMVAVDRDGMRYPCHRFMHFSAGKSVTMDEFNAPDFNASAPCACDECPMIRACPTCAGHNWEYNGNINQRVTHNCEFVKLQMVATAALKVNRICQLVDSEKISEIEDEPLAELAYDLKVANKTFEFLADVPQAELKPYVTGEWPGGEGWENRVRWRQRGAHSEKPPGGSQPRPESSSAQDELLPT